MGFIIALIILVLLIVLIFLYVRVKLKSFLLANFNTSSISEAFNKTDLESQSTPRSLSSMESIYLPKIKKDFPNLNINELKAQAESVILRTIEAIEERDKKALIGYDKINAYINGRITDAEEMNAHYNSALVHRTVINRYEKNGGIATIYFQSSFEYVLKVGEEKPKKVQSRMNTECIYIVDEKTVSAKEKTLGLNCPNCGAPLKGVGQRVCKYCGTGTEDIVKRSWTINNIAEY